MVKGKRFLPVDKLTPVDEDAEFPELDEQQFLPRRRNVYIAS